MKHILSIGFIFAATHLSAAPPKVVTDTTVVHSLTAMIMDGIGAPEILLDRGADAHSFQLRPSQAASVADANLIIWLGPQMTSWLERPIANLGAEATKLELLELEGLSLRDYGDAHDHDHDHNHGDGDSSGESIDPHAWLDPANALIWLDAISAELAALDPENAPLYAKNTLAAKAGIQQMDAEISAELAPLGGRSFVVFHDAYGYFTEHYGLEQAHALALGDATTPGAARISALKADILEEGAVCLFPEAQHDPALLLTLAEESGVRVGPPLDPEGSSAEPGPGAYAAVMRGLSTALKTCLAP